MPKMNFRGVEDFSPLPSGSYLCRIEDVEESTTRYGDEMWRLKLSVVEGPHDGRHIFDNMVFSDKAQKRVKHICSSLGLDVSGEVDLQPSAIKGRSCYVTVEVRNYIGSDGAERKVNAVLFNGYSRADGVEQQTGKSLPF